VFADVDAASGNLLVGMGAVVTKSVAPGATVVGNPARPMG